MATFYNGGRTTSEESYDAGKHAHGHTHGHGHDHGHGYGRPNIYSKVQTTYEAKKDQIEAGVPGAAAVGAGGYGEQQGYGMPVHNN